MNQTAAPMFHLRRNDIDIYILTNIPQTDENAKLFILTHLERQISESKLHAGTYAGITMTM